MHDRVIRGDLVIDKIKDLPLVDHVTSVIQESPRWTNWTCNESVKDFEARPSG